MTARKIGTADGLRFDLGWLKAAKAEISVCVGCDVLWGDAGGGVVRPFDLDMTDLLEFLGAFWPGLCHEEGYPIAVRPLFPSKLRADARKHFEAVSHEERLAEADRLFAWEQCHDLALAFPGMILPSVLLVAEGERMWVSPQGKDYDLERREVLETLESLGNVLFERLSKLDGARAVYVCDLWATRNDVTAETVVAVTTGMDRRRVSELCGSQTVMETFAMTSANDNTEILAVARMMGTDERPDVLRDVMARIKREEHRATPELDRLGGEAMKILRSARRQRFYEQGHELALWFREQEGTVAFDASVDPEEILTRLNVSIHEITLTNSLVDAVACWGPSHGPAIFLNLAGSHQSSDGGRKATLAHELCHLLVDRHGALPLAEAMGGRVPAGPEKRANAFAAELLLPRSLAAEAYERRRDPDLAVDELCSSFGVSRQLAANQICNSDAAISSQHKWILRGFLQE